MAHKCGDCEGERRFGLSRRSLLTNSIGGFLGFAMARTIRRLNADVGQAMQAQDTIERFNGLGLTALHSTPERVTELVKTGVVRMGQVVKAAGIQPE